jgi:hypothetical protein
MEGIGKGVRIPFHLSRDSWLAIGLFVLLAIISAVSIYQQTTDAEKPALTSFSTQPDGARALWLWLDKLGYNVSDRVGVSFSIPEGTDFMLLLEPTISIEAHEWQMIDDWLEAGGTLLVAGNDFVANQAFLHFDFSVNFRAAAVAETKQQNPLMASPPIETLPLSEMFLTLQTERDDFVTHFTLDGAPVVVSVPRADGRVILTTFTFPLTNEGLKEAGNPEFALNLISASGEIGQIWFDEWHHGVRVEGTEVAGLGAWLRQTPVGRSFLFMATVIFVALVLQGRPFGRPVPLPQDTSRRAPLEYITALANLSRRAGHRTAVLQDYHHRLKKTVGHRYRLDPTLSDDEFLAQLAEYNPNFDLAALHTLLQRLSVPNISESDMVQLAAEVSEWLNH